MRAALILSFLLVGCFKTPSKDATTEPTIIGNRYEIIEIGPYTCVSSKGWYNDAGGGIWCERTFK